ncbi:MAG: hypothetical protein HGA31_06360, partial [Candidatus Moranbacteria bacterium]|nr:hypothetical protein [Candidatus Moranbacteria bacterium]
SVVGNRFASGPLTGTVVMLVTAVAVTLFSFRNIRTEDFLNWKIIALLTVLGIFNAFGVIRYSDRLSQPDIPTAAFVVVTSIAMVAIAPLLEYALSGKHLTVGHVFGYICAAGAIMFLSK